MFYDHTLQSLVTRRSHFIQELWTCLRVELFRSNNDVVHPRHRHPWCFHGFVVLTLLGLVTTKNTIYPFTWCLYSSTHISCHKPETHTHTQFGFYPDDWKRTESEYSHTRTVTNCSHTKSSRWLCLSFLLCLCNARLAIVLVFWGNLPIHPPTQFYGT